MLDVNQESEFSRDLLLSLLGKIRDEYSEISIDAISQAHLKNPEEVPSYGIFQKCFGSIEAMKILKPVEKRRDLLDLTQTYPNKKSALFNKFVVWRNSARRRNIGWHLTIEDIWGPENTWDTPSFNDKMKCYISGIPLTTRINCLNTMSLDRINSEFAYVKSNISLAASSVNIAKNSMGMDNYLLFCSSVAKNADDVRIRIKSINKHVVNEEFFKIKNETIIVRKTKGQILDDLAKDTIIKMLSKDVLTKRSNIFKVCFSKGISMKKMDKALYELLEGDRVVKHISNTGSRGNPFESYTLVNKLH